MVSTYLSYDLVTRDIKSSLKRVAGDAQVSREAQYYKENIGKVTSVEEFLADDKLYNFAMTAHGLEDMAYAKGFMKKVLESDLTDDNSYANLLTDTRYRNFAAAFSFTGAATAETAQSSAQEDALIGLYGTTIADAAQQLSDDTRFYDAVMDKITSVDDLLNNDRLRKIVFTSFGVNEASYSRTEMRQILASDYNDPASYVHTVYDPKLAEVDQKRADAEAKYAAGGLTAAESAKLAEQITSYSNARDRIVMYFSLAAAFEFQPDGTVVPGSAQSEANQRKTEELYITKTPRVTPAAALLNKAYFESKMATVTNVSEVLGDARLYSYIRTAFGLTSAAIVKSTVEYILTSDVNDPASYINTTGKPGGTYKPGYLELANAFNFQTDGTVASGDTAQTAAQTKFVNDYYMVTYNDVDDKADETAIASYKTKLKDVTSLDKFMSVTDVYNFALKAVGLDPKTESTLTIKKVMASDLTDPKSFVYTLKDERYVKLAGSFNFDSKGEIGAPLVAQSDATIIDISKNYIIQKTRFLEDAEKKTARTAADKEAEYYKAELSTMKTVSEFLSDRRLVDFVLVARGIDPATVTDEYMKKMFDSDLSDPESFANTEPNGKFGEIVASFNFDAKGNLLRVPQSSVQDPGEVLHTTNMYLQQTLETEQGNENAGVRLALYFERMASTVTSAYDILGDTALLEVFRTIYSLPAELSNMDVDMQAKIVEKYMTLSDLQDPKKLDDLVKRFTILFDMNSDSGGSSSALTILTGGGSAGGLSADTLMALTQLKSG